MPEPTEPILHDHQPPEGAEAAAHGDADHVAAVGAVSLANEVRQLDEGLPETYDDWPKFSNKRLIELAEGDDRYAKGARRQLGFRTRDALVDLARKDEKKPYSDEDKELFLGAMAAYGFDPKASKDIIIAWNSLKVHDAQGRLDSRKLAQYGHILFLNFNNMELIRDADPEGPSRLYQDYGIRNFNRYNPHTLVRQLDPAAAIDRRKAAIGSAHDHNAVTTVWYNTPENAAEAALGANSAPPVFMEAESAAEAKYRQRQQRDRTGRKLDWVMLSAHSAPDTFAFTERRDGVVTAAQIRQDPDASPIATDAVTRDVVVVLNGCDTSADKMGGIATVIHEQTGAPVVGMPDKSAGLERGAAGFGRLRVHVPDGQGGKKWVRVETIGHRRVTRVAKDVGRMLVGRRAA